MVLYEYRRRTLSGENDKANALNRNLTAVAKCLFAASVQGDTINIEKYNMISNNWDPFRKINISKTQRQQIFQLVWDENFIFTVGGYSSRSCTFVQRASVAACSHFTQGITKLCSILSQ